MMRPTFAIRVLLAGWVVVMIAGAPVAVAEEETFTLQPLDDGKAAPLPGGRRPQDLSGLEPQPMFPPKTLVDPKAPAFRDSGLGHYHHMGAPDDGGIGYRHYDFPSYRYDIWYRPHAFGWGQAERCSPSPFRPRGLGNLFNEPSNCYRMDYSRYQVKNYQSDYGPSYYRNLPDPRCPDWDMTGQYRAGCDPCRLRNTRVWTLGQNGVEEN